MNAVRTPMASHRLPSRRRHHGRRAGGFTLIELIVVIGIISLLAAVIVPVVIHARKNAANTRTRQDLETIRVALDSYKAVWNMYPPITPLPATPDSPPSDPTKSINNIDQQPIIMDNGAHALYSALMLKGQVRVSRSSNGTAVVVGGTTAYGPFLNTQQVKPAPDPAFSQTYPQFPASTTNLFICDANGNPILYIPASPVPLNYTTTATKTATNPYLAVGPSTSNPGVPIPFFDFTAVPTELPDPNSPGQTVVPFHNASYSNGGLNEMRFLMGDTNQNGFIETNGTPPETAAAPGPYILWTAGADGRFGVNPSTQKTDDIANFDFPAQLRE